MSKILRTAKAKQDAIEIFEYIGADNEEADGIEVLRILHERQQQRLDA